MATGITQYDNQNPGKPPVLNGKQHGCFCKLGVLVVGVLVTRAPLIGLYFRAPDFWKRPHGAWF